MRILLTAAVTAIAVASATSVLAGPKDMALCTKMTQGWQAAYNSKDVAKVAAMYEPTKGVFSNAFWTAAGRGAIEEGMKKEVASGTHFEEIKCDAAYRDGSLLVGVGTYTASAIGPDGKPTTISGHWLSTVTDDHGKYLIVNHTSNMQMPPPPDR